MVFQESIVHFASNNPPNYFLEIRWIFSGSCHEPLTLSHCQSLTWNLKMTASKRNLLCQGAIFGWTMLYFGRVCLLSSFSSSVSSSLHVILCHLSGHWGDQMELHAEFVITCHKISRLRQSQRFRAQTNSSIVSYKSDHIFIIIASPSLAKLFTVYCILFLDIFGLRMATMVKSRSHVPYMLQYESNWANALGVPNFWLDISVWNISWTSNTTTATEWLAGNMFFLRLDDSLLDTENKCWHHFITWDRDLNGPYQLV